MLSGLLPADAAGLLEEVWSLAGIEPVGGRGAAEIAQRLVRRAQVAQAPALSADQADAVRRFLAISEAPRSALEQVRALSGDAGPALARALADWTTRLDRLAALGVPVDQAQFAAALGHAFDYYDGMTFEIRSRALGEARPLAVGGRYDGLIARLGDGARSGAVGCMVRPWRAFAGGEA
jgi:ATP phosphoribosyltransferase regulatory subunit